MIELSRRRFIRGAGLLLAAPAIVQAASLMPVRAVAAPEPLIGFWHDRKNVLAVYGHDDVIRWEYILSDGTFSPVFDEPLTVEILR